MKSTVPAGWNSCQVSNRLKSYVLTCWNGRQVCCGSKTSLSTGWNSFLARDESSGLEVDEGLGSSLVCKTQISLKLTGLLGGIYDISFLSVIAWNRS